MGYVSFQEGIPFPKFTDATTSKVHGKIFPADNQKGLTNALDPKSSTYILMIFSQQKPSPTLWFWGFWGSKKTFSHFRKGKTYSSSLRIRKISPKSLPFQTLTGWSSLWRFLLQVPPAASAEAMQLPAKEASVPSVFSKNFPREKKKSVKKHTT